jgi:uncharacterized protein YkwD
MLMNHPVKNPFQKGENMHHKSIWLAALLLAASVCAFPQSITLLSPNGGESWPLGSEQAIAWSVKGYSASLSIMLTQNGADVGLIAKNVSPAAGSYKWTVGKLLNGQAVAGDGYRVRIGSPDWALKDGSDNKFALSAALVKKMPANLSDLKFNRFEQPTVERRPNLAAVKLTYKLPALQNHWSINNLLIVGTVKNIGPAAFPYSGTATLYRDTSIISQKNLPNLGYQETFSIEGEDGVNYEFTPQGISCHPEYRLEIAYAPDIQARPEQIDANWANNQTKLAGQVIALDAYQTYATSYRQQLAALINQYRQGNGLAPLALDPCLSNVAQAHSEWMNTTNTFSHIGKGGSTREGRCQQAGCPCQAENIFNGTDFPSSAFQAWKASPGHNAAMLGSYSKIGIGICSGWITADFN